MENSGCGGALVFPESAGRRMGCGVVDDGVAGWEGLCTWREGEGGVTEDAVIVSDDEEVTFGSEDRVSASKTSVGGVVEFDSSPSSSYTI